MMQITSPAHLLEWIVFAFFGATIGAGHLSALAWNTRVLLHAGSPALAIALPLLRIALAGGSFFLAAQHGGGPLLSSLAGFLGARAAGFKIAGARP